MGQRLVVVVESKGEEIACCYYHWSGDTFSALGVVANFFERYEHCKSLGEEDDLLLAIQGFTYLEKKSGAIAGLDGEGIETATAKYPELYFPECINRNDGIISITEDTIEEAKSTAENLVYIDISNKTIDFNACARTYGDDVVEYYMEMEEVSQEEAESFINSLKVYDFDIEEIPFSKFDELSYIFTVDGTFRDVNGDLIIPIE